MFINVYSLETTVFTFMIKVLHFYQKVKKSKKAWDNFQYTNERERDRE